MYPFKNYLSELRWSLMLRKNFHIHLNVLRFMIRSAENLFGITTPTQKIIISFIFRRISVISLHKTMKFILFFVGVVYDSRVIHTVQQFFLLTTKIVRKFYISLNNTHLNNTRWRFKWPFKHHISTVFMFKGCHNQ